MSVVKPNSKRPARSSNYCPLYRRSGQIMMAGGGANGIIIIPSEPPSSSSPPPDWTWLWVILIIFCLAVIAALGLN